MQLKLPESKPVLKGCAIRAPQSWASTGVHFRAERDTSVFAHGAQAHRSLGGHARGETASIVLRVRRANPPMNPPPNRSNERNPFATLRVGHYIIHNESIINKNTYNHQYTRPLVLPFSTRIIRDTTLHPEAPRYHATAARRRGLCSHYIYSSMGRGLELDPTGGAFIKRVDAFTDPPPYAASSEEGRSRLSITSSRRSSSSGGQPLNMEVRSNGIESNCASQRYRGPCL